jgi:3-hydroxy-3-methylglutaryl CoA synthase
MGNTGITSLGVYIPYFYLSRQTIATAWGAKGRKGVRSIANVDEDSVTMAVEATRQCLRFTDKKQITHLYFATASAPYSEKSGAGLVNTVCDFPRNTLIADFQSCIKGGTTAIRAAMDAARANAGTQALVVAADCRKAYPKSEKEQMFGDGAAAVVIGNENVLATIDDFATASDEIVDIWRNEGDKFVLSGEDRFIKEEGYLPSLIHVIKEVLGKSKLAPKDITKAIFSTPGMREYTELAKKTGFEPEQIQDPLMLEVGNCGTAQVLLLLNLALEEAKPGDRLLVANYGNGADAMILTVTDEIARIQKKPIVKSLLANRSEFTDYGRFLSFNGICPADPGAPYGVPASNSMTWRKQDVFLRLKGSKCKKCGQELFPISRVCSKCGSIDEYEQIDCANRVARVATFTIDWLAGQSDDPIVGQIVADDDQGTRYYTILTDFNPKVVKIEIGMPLEFTFRKMNMLGNFTNYFWKFKPIREGGELR